MTKRRRRGDETPLDRSPIMGMAETAIAAGAKHAVLIYINRDDERICISTPDLSLLETAGLLAVVVADLACGGVEGEVEDDLEV